MSRRSAGGSGAVAVVAVAALAWLAVVALALSAARLPGEASGRMVAIFPPAIGAADALAAVAAADGVLVRQTMLANVVVVEDDAAGFAGRLAAAGAWMTLRPFAVDPIALVGCLGLPRDPDHRVRAPLNPI